MRLTSWIIEELTHTMNPYQSHCNNLHLWRYPSTHSLCESGSHFGSWNCSHIERRHCDHRQGCGSQTLLDQQVSRDHASRIATNLRIHVRTAQSDLSCIVVSSRGNLGPRFELTSSGDRRVHSEPTSSVFPPSVEWCSRRSGGGLIDKE